MAIFLPVPHASRSSLSLSPSLFRVPSPVAEEAQNRWRGQVFLGNASAIPGWRKKRPRSGGLTPSVIIPQWRAANSRRASARPLCYREREHYDIGKVDFLLFALMEFATLRTGGSFEILGAMKNFPAVMWVWKVGWTDSQWVINVIRCNLRFLQWRKERVSAKVTFDFEHTNGQTLSSVRNLNKMILI